jgi:hypothetical protein
MKLLIVGYGKMGHLIDQMAQDLGMEVVGRVDEGRDEWTPADVAIDFTTADALVKNFPAYIERSFQWSSAPPAGPPTRRSSANRRSGPTWAWWLPRTFPSV